ncbi:MAG: ribulose-phosphate 3-epimerase [Actinomycetota bacterium]|nr:ribulose-phosphate 3-epimerase [Actinomycetota bacterium]
MDGHIAPNLAFGSPVVSALRSATDIPLDCHLMIENPDRWARGYAEVGARNVTVHIEAARHPVALAGDLRTAGALAGLAISPVPAGALPDAAAALRHAARYERRAGIQRSGVIPEVLNKVRTARRLIDNEHLRLLIEIDGGINAETIQAAAQAGVDCFVAGLAVYGTEDPAHAVASFASKRRAPQPTPNR